MSEIILRVGSAEAVLNTHGARLLKWNVNGVDGLYHDPAKPNRSTHPCGPNFGPLSSQKPLDKDGCYKVSGFLYKLHQHGFLRDKEWQICQVTSTSVKLELAHTREDVAMEAGDQDDPFVNYPFFFRFTNFIALRKNSLQYELAFYNLDTHDAPVDLASHTYHPFEPGLGIPELAGLSYNDQTIWEKQMRKELSRPTFDAAEERDWHFDLGKGRIFSLRYPSGRTIILNASENVEQVVIWTSPEEGNFFCFEPVLRGRNSLNNGRAIMVKPGESVALQFILTLN